MKPLLTLLCVIASAMPAVLSAQQTAISVPEQDKEGAQELALWEIGAGFGIARTPNYPAASGSRTRALPLPVVIYRGDFFRIGDGSVASGKLFENDRMELDISLNGSFDAESDDIDVRAGMPDLGFVFEVGPELEIILSDPAVTDERWKLELPVRAAASLDDSEFSSRGFVFSPQLEYERTFADGRYEWSVSLTPSFATRRLHDYFFTVAPEFATAERPAFEADSGYLQTTIGLGLQRRGRKSFAAIGLAYTRLDGSANENSPLFEEKQQLAIGAFIVYRFWESERRATR
ncbi:MAG: MipA/OmpV family protein [Pseudomonadota bacterium]